jgi:hypothetical protein
MSAAAMTIFEQDLESVLGLVVKCVVVRGRDIKVSIGGGGPHLSASQSLPVYVVGLNVKMASPIHGAEIYAFVQLH